jgi:hypothetical protein
MSVGENPNFPLPVYSVLPGQRSSTNTPDSQEVDRNADRMLTAANIHGARRDIGGLTAKRVSASLR